MKSLALPVAGSLLLLGCSVADSRGMYGSVRRANLPATVETLALPVESASDRARAPALGDTSDYIHFEPEEAPPRSAAPPKESEEGLASAREAPAQTAPRLVVYTARFEILVANVADSIARFLKSVEGSGGYLERRDNERVTVRVPASEFSKVVEDLRGYGNILSEQVRAEDVTRKYFDLKVRIENAEKARERLLALLEKAQEIEAILRIEGEIRRLSEEIDRWKGELRYLSEAIAYSTIEVAFRSAAPPPQRIALRKPSRYGWVNELGVEHVLQRF